MTTLHNTHSFIESENGIIDEVYLPHMKQNRESTERYLKSYYPTSTLGNNLSTSSGTWVVVKSKIEKVPRDIRRRKFKGIAFKDDNGEAKS